MNNKKHNIIDDAWEMDERMMGGAAHSMRVGLITNTVLNSTPIVIPDIRELSDVPEKFSLDFKKLETLATPLLLNWQVNDVQVSVLVVHDKDSGHIQCFPFSNQSNEGGYWWVYDLAFDLVPSGQIEIRPIHPIVEEDEAFAEPTKEMIDHLEVLALVVSTFVYKLQNGNIVLEQEVRDIDKLNKKRVGNKKSPIALDWIPKYVQNS